MRHSKKGGKERVQNCLNGISDLPILERRAAKAGVLGWREFTAY
jgi:hypothetical protein